MTARKDVAGPQPRVHPVVMMISFSILLGFCCGAAYNANGVKEFYRESGILEGVPGEELLLMLSIKIFQSADVFLGALVGVTFDLLGPRITHGFGYLLFFFGCVLMKWPATIWWAFLLQGCANAFLLSSVVHIANLFEHGSKFAMSVLTAAADLGCALFPAMAYAVRLDYISADAAIFSLAGVGAFGLVWTIVLFPDAPFYPRSEVSRAAIDAAEDPNFEDKTVQGFRADSRDEWGEIEEHQKNENSSLLDNPHGDRRVSNLSVSMVGYLDHRSSDGIKIENVRPKNERFVSQLTSPEWFLITIVFTFFVVRGNLYLNGNEQILASMGDGNGELARVFGTYLPFCTVAALLNGVLMEFIGVIPTCAFLNLLAIASNLLSMTTWLNLQRLTFILVLFSRSSSWSFLFAYSLEALGLNHFVLMSGLSMVICGVTNHFGGEAIINYVMRHGVQEWYWVNWGLALGGAALYVPLLVMWLMSSSRLRATKNLSVV